MNNGWVKLYRKIKDNGILTDPLCWTVFSWLLLSVNQLGKIDIGRFSASKELRINPNTFYKVLKRLEKKWQLITLRSNNKYSTIEIVNWDSEQKYPQESNSSSNNKVTTGQQQSNTKQEVKNQEYENINNGDASPEIKGFKKIQFLLPKFQTDTHVSTRQQDEALRFAEKLRIDLDKACTKDPSYRARWFHLFKANEVGKLQSAYTNLIDSDSFQSADDEGKIKYFFWAYHRL